MYQHGFLAPVVALIVWSLLMLVWLYVTRIPAMLKAKIDPNKATAEDMAMLPPGARSVANNYNHLMEQPTIFYAACFVLQLQGVDDHFAIGWAWAYVALRVLHSLIQATGNVTIRFFIFVLSSVCLAVLTYYAAVSVGMIAWGA